ncbi:MAG: hypothetical protein E7042_08815 [Lentisphaerae bacterium]|nr:hypothetical protein [Lentisphaerota bacterium]
MKIQFGIGRKCINPEVPISLAGYFNKRMWTQILDDIEVRAVVFKDGDNTGAIINMDILSINWKLYGAIRDAITAAGITGFDENNLLICATHTHTAPLTGGDPNSDVYNEFAGKKAAEALKEALANMEEGEILTAMTSDSRFIFNRRYWMKDGRVVTNPGKLNPDIVRPEGDIDPEIPMIAFRTAAGIKLLFTSMVNHTDTIGGCGVSADWPGFLRRTVEPQLAPGAMMVTMVGTSGNINHFDVSTDMDQTCYAEPERIGKGYAETVLAALDKLAPISGEGFKVNSQKVTTGVREVDPEEIAAAEAVIAKYPDIDVNSPESVKDLTSEDLAKGTPFALKYFANALLAVVNKTIKPSFLLHCFKFGDSTILGSLPSEPFVEIGLVVRKGVNAGKFCMITSHGNCNGGESYYGGYIPNPWNYGRGGYEDTPRSSGYSKCTSEALVAGWYELAKK